MTQIRTRKNGQKYPVTMQARREMNLGPWSSISTDSDGNEVTAYVERADDRVSLWKLTLTRSSGPPEESTFETIEKEPQFYRSRKAAVEAGQKWIHKMEFSK